MALCKERMIFEKKSMPITDIILQLVYLYRIIKQVYGICNQMTYSINDHFNTSTINYDSLPQAKEFLFLTLSFLFSLTNM